MRSQLHITVFGCGYVGLVTAACLSELGHHVCGIDVDEKRVSTLNQCIIPIYEPDLEQMIARNLQLKRLMFTTDPKVAISQSEMLFIAVGTPSDEDGSADLKYVLDVAKTIGQHLEHIATIVTKSTVPVGSADKVKNIIATELTHRQKNIEFHVASNPEFLREGSAINDFMEPDRIVVGVANEQVAKQFKTLYQPINPNDDKIIIMDIRSSELTKYAANAMLATKISLMNELSNIAEKVGADIEHVRIGIGSDARIGFNFINPGCGYGGSCFPKDVKALCHLAESHAYDSKILNSVQQINQLQKEKLFEKINDYFKQNLTGKTIALWGLAFKPNTDDMREAPSLTVINQLLAANAKVQAYDPIANQVAKNIIGPHDNFTIAKNCDDALEGADALVIVTEWEEFKNPDFNRIKQQLNYPVIFDGRNLYHPDTLQAMGIDYYSIGRGLKIRASSRSDF